MTNPQGPRVPVFVASQHHSIGGAFLVGVCESSDCVSLVDTILQDHIKYDGGELGHCAWVGYSNTDEMPNVC